MQINHFRWMVCASVVVAGGCHPGPRPEWSKNDAFLIKSSAANWAWGGGSEYGCCIASDGAVARYRYNLGSRRPVAAPPPAKAAAAADLMARYCPGAQTVGHATELAGKGSLLATASTAPIQEQAVAIDAPAHGVDGYFLDSGSRQYHEVVLAAAGDIKRVNPSPAAAELLQWSQGVFARFGCAMP